jgi:hypothetical protein
MDLNHDDLTDLLSYNATTGRAGYSIATGVRGEQTVVRDVYAAKGWTSIVPMDLNHDGLTDLLSYNATTGRAGYSIATGVGGEQTVVKQVVAAEEWIPMVPSDSLGDKNQLAPVLATDKPTTEVLASQGFDIQLAGTSPLDVTV